MPALHDDISSFARAIVLGGQVPPQIAAHYRDYTAAVAIAVYRNNYRGNLHDTLAGAYPVIEQLVGKDFFRMMARNYIEQHPSRSGNLHHYGAGMAGFIAGFEPAQTLPYLPDVAALEWACHCAWFADDAAAFDIARLAQISPDRYPGLVLLVDPACRLVRSVYPIAPIWHAHQREAAGDFHIDLDSGPCRALVTRTQEAVVVSELPVADAAWLEALQAGTTLGDATAAARERYPDFDLQAALLNLVALQALTGFSPGMTS